MIIRQTRMKGGERNPKSGQTWTREELKKVLHLYLDDRQIKIHETNIKIQDLANELGRTARSVEAQLLMYRNLDKFGYYGYGKMNNICKVLWKEYIDSTII